MLLPFDSPPKLAGKKRKHYTATEDNPTIKLTGKLHHYLKEMRKNAKKSKTFETQRVVKKLREIRKPAHVGAEDIKELESQLESLKNTDHERIAHIALSSKIRKDKVLSSNNALMTSMASALLTVDAKTETRNVKVESRLLSSKILAAAAQEAVEGLRAVLEPVITAKSHSIVNPVPAADTGQNGDEEIDEQTTAELRLGSNAAGGDSSDRGDTEETSILENVLDETDDMVDDDGWESGSIDDSDPASSVEEEEGPSPPRKKNREPSSSSFLGSLVPSSSANTSTFLPSLSVGYIKGDSGSDNDPSDDETPANGRKNRRGQRARQAIWGKKYGRSAKHLKKQREDVQALATARSLGKRPDKGWDGRRQGGSGSPTVSVPTVNTKRLVHTQGQHKLQLSSEKPTHPSWEAKRKLKEKESARILPSQGKKIVFT